MPIDIGQDLNGTIGSASSILFSLSLFTNYPSVTVSTCQPAPFNQFNLSLTVFNASQSEIAFDEGSCPGDARQAEIVLTDVSAGNYTILLGQLENGNPSDLWDVAIDAETFSPTEQPTVPTAQPTAEPTDSSDSSDSGSDSQSGSDSGSGSDSDSESAEIFSANIENKSGNNLDNLMKNVQQQDVHVGESELVISADGWTIFNMWAMVFVLLLSNALCCYAYKKRQVNVGVGDEADVDVDV